MPSRWHARVAMGVVATILCLHLIVRKDNENENTTTNNFENKSNFSLLMEKRRSVVREQCSLLKKQGRRRSSYLVPENFLTIKK